MKTSKPIRIACLLAAAALLASCAALEKQDATLAARYNAYAGQPVDHFMWLAEHRGWAAISDNQLIAWADANRPYLITVAQPCPNLWFDASGITSSLDEVGVHRDYVLAAGRGCAIQTIRPIDYLRMRHDVQRQADARRTTPENNLRG